MAGASFKYYASVVAWIVLGFALHALLHPRCFSQDVYLLHVKRLAAYFSGYQHGYQEVTVTETPREVRVFCWVLTTPANHLKKARHVKATWGRRCTKLLFVSSEEDFELGAVALDVGEGRQKLWAKTRAAFTHLYKYRLDEADWFLKADDDTYVVMENLRHHLSQYDPSKPHYIGCHLRLLDKNNNTFPDAGYMSGGAGYVVSRAALQIVVEEGFRRDKKCLLKDSYAEDVVFGKCLEKVGVRTSDTQDLQGYARFVPLAPLLFRWNDTAHVDSKWYKQHFYKQKNGTVFGCCSETAISYHYVKPREMYLFEYFIYRLRVHGVR